MKTFVAKQMKFGSDSKIQSLGKASRKTMGGFIEVFPDRNWGKFQEN